MKRLLVLAAIAGAGSCAAAEDLRAWTFDRGAEGWVTIPGTVTKTAWDRDSGALRWEYARAEGGPTFGVSVSGLKLPDVETVYLRLRVRVKGAKFLLAGVKTASGEAYCTKFPVPDDAWHEVRLSTEVFIPGKKPVRPADVRELLLWDAADGVERGTVTAFLDSLAVERTPPPPATVEMPAPVEPHPKLAVCLSFRAMEDPKQAAIELDEARRLGIGMVELANSEWTDYETAPGTWDWSKLDPLVKEVAKRDLKLVACAGGIVNLKYDYKVHVPTDVPFDGDFAALLPRYRAYLDRFFERYGRHVAFFTFHSERCGAYFDKHPGQVDSYEAFLRAACAHVKRLAPAVRTGVCLVHDERPDLLRRLTKIGDVTTILYDPAHTPDYAAAEIASFFELAGDRPLAFNEVFTRGGARTGVSEGQQAEFVKALFSSLRARADRLAWCTWWCLRDDNVETWRFLGEYLTGGKGPAANAFLDFATCGLLRGDGSAKPATVEWARGAAALPR